MAHPDSLTADPAGEPEISFLDLAIVLAEHLRLLIIAPVAAAAAALSIAFLVPPTFTAATRILPPLQQQSVSASVVSQLGGLAGLVGNAAGIKSPAEQYAALLKSRTVYDAVIRRFKLQERYDERYLEDARRELARRTAVTVSHKDGMISLEVDDEDARRAADIANGFIDELRALTNTLAVTEAAQRRAFFETQLDQAKENLTRSELALRGSGVGEAALKTLPQSALEAVARLKAQITAQEVRIAALRPSMTEENPQLRLAMHELAALRGELRKAEETNSLKASGAGAEYVARYRDFKYHELLFDLMARQYELARLDEAKEGGVIQVVDRAVPPERKSKPRKALVALLAGVIAFFAAIVFALARHSVRAMKSDPVARQKVALLVSLLPFGSARR